MARFRKPFLVEPRGLWWVRLHGKRINPGHHKESAFKRYGKLMAQPEPPKIRF